jgi:hypothetical protein
MSCSESDVKSGGSLLTIPTLDQRSRRESWVGYWLRQGARCGDPSRYLDAINKVRSWYGFPGRKSVVVVFPARALD